MKKLLFILIFSFLICDFLIFSDGIGTNMEIPRVPSEYELEQLQEMRDERYRITGVQIEQKGLESIVQQTKGARIVSKIKEKNEKERLEQEEKERKEAAIAAAARENKLLYTIFQNKGSRSCADQIRQRAGGLVSFYENSLYDEQIDHHLHSIAVDPRVIPYGTIIYITEFELYFIANDCSSNKMMDGRKSEANQKGAEFWIDIYVAPGEDYEKFKKQYKKYVDQGVGILHYRIVRKGY